MLDYRYSTGSLYFSRNATFRGSLLSRFRYLTVKFYRYFMRIATFEGSLLSEFLVSRYISYIFGVLILHLIVLTELQFCCSLCHYFLSGIPSKNTVVTGKPNFIVIVSVLLAIFLLAIMIVFGLLFVRRRRSQEKRCKSPVLFCLFVCLFVCLMVSFVLYRAEVAIPKSRV